MHTVKLQKRWTLAALLLLANAAQAQEFTSTISPTHGTDTFAFSLAKDSVVTLESTLSGQLSAGNSGFGIKASDGNTDVVRIGYAHPGVVEGPWPLKAGNYYLTVYSVCGCAGSYMAKLNATPVNLLNDAEPNDSAVTAIALPFDTQASGYLGFYNGFSQDFTDHYAITLPAEGKLAITTSHDINGVFAVEVLQSDASTVVRDTSVPLPAGKYYVKTYTNSFYTYGQYTLSVNFIPTVPQPVAPPEHGVINVSTPVANAREVNPILIFAPTVSERNGSYQLYVAALYANQLYFLTLENFQKRVVPYTGGEPPAYQVANGTDLYADQPNGGFSAQTWYIGLGDLSALSGLQLFAGFGRSGTDMVSRGQIAHIYTVP